MRSDLRRLAVRSGAVWSSHPRASSTERQALRLSGNRDIVWCGMHGVLYAHLRL